MADPSLLEAYRATHYLVDLPAGTVRLRVDQPCPALAQWLAALSMRGAALVTAHNPRSMRRDDASNARAQRELLQALCSPGIVLATGRNVDPAGLWPDEPSVLAAGITEAAADALALRFGQLAFLWCDAAGMVRLRLASLSR